MHPRGSRGWTPILYLAYTRFSHPPVIEHALDIARLLLDRGADPNDFYMAGDARYSVLTGVAGEGEQDSPRQPYAPQLFDLLLQPVESLAGEGLLGGCQHARRAHAEREAGIQASSPDPAHAAR